MQVQVHSTTIHSPERVREILKAAEKIANDFTADPDDWRTVFAAAAQLLGQAYSFAAQQEPVSVALGSLPALMNGGRR